MYRKLIFYHLFYIVPVTFIYIFNYGLHLCSFWDMTDFVLSDTTPYLAIVYSTYDSNVYVYVIPDMCLHICIFIHSV